MENPDPSPEGQHAPRSQGEGFDFAVAVFAANEAEHLESCAQAIAAAATGRRTCLDIVLNGTRDDSLARLRALDLSAVTMRVWQIKVGDKANAINLYLHEIAPDASVYFMMDAYARIEPTALSALERALRTDAEAWIASGVPRNGRSAAAYTAQVLRGGAVNGNLYALRPSFVRRLRELGLRLPHRLYRSDGLLGSMAAHDCDAVNSSWKTYRLIGVAEAGYSIVPLSILRPRDLRRQFRREVNQARGVLENEAIKGIIYRDGYGALPDDADAMLRSYLSSGRNFTGNRRQRLFLPLVTKRLRGRVPPPSATADRKPLLVHEVERTSERPHADSC